MAGRNLITRVVLTNYKSIRHCDVRLQPLTFLVGPNGSGKSNFVEALRFLAVAVRGSLLEAIENRSGYDAVERRGSAEDSIVGFEISFRLGDGTTGKYIVELARDELRFPTVNKERCEIVYEGENRWFENSEEGLTSDQGRISGPSKHRLFLSDRADYVPFEGVYRAMAGVVVYNPIPDQIRGVKKEKRYGALDRNASALAETIWRLSISNPERMARLLEYLRRINPSVLDVGAFVVKAHFALEFKLQGKTEAESLFLSENISDGTLRALAILVALFQDTGRDPLTLVGLEEPEAGLHPAAAGVLFDSLIEGSARAQVLVTSHSPDLLDRKDVSADWLRAVAMCNGATMIGEIDEAGRSALKENLYTAGELLRMDQLRPEGFADCLTDR